MNIICLTLILVSILSCKNHEPEDYLIPEGFRGRVNVIFNQKNGASPKYENGRRIYEIPSGGILLTRFKDEYGFVDHSFYYIGVNGKRTPLKILNVKMFTGDISTGNKIEVGIFLDGTTGQYGNNGDSTAIKYQEVIVSSYNGLDSFYTHEYKKEFENKVTKITGLKF